MQNNLTQAAIRFNKFLAPSQGGCHEWTGSCYPNGYGAFRLGGKVVGAHRAALILKGVAIPDGMEVCHRCDNKKCVNPEHLFIGTKSDNMKDAQNKGRLPLPKKAQSIIDFMSDEEVLGHVRRCGSIVATAAELVTGHTVLRKRLKKIFGEEKYRLTFPQGKANNDF